MITVEETTEFVPHGRAIVDGHPRNIFGDGVPDTGGEEWWEVRGTEELYTRGSTVVWSRGGNTHKCFTLREPVLQTLRCTFQSESPKVVAGGQDTNEQEPGGEAGLSCVVARDASVLRVFSEQGQDLRVALQFAVRKCWETRYGLMLEREGVRREGVGREEEGEQALPVLYALLHPLDDFSRVVTRQGGRLAEWTEASNRLVFVSCSPSLAVSYNAETEQHSVWRVRRASQQEAQHSLYLEGREGEASGSQAHSHTPSTKDSLRLGQHSASPGPWLHHNSSLASPLGSRGATPTHSRAASPMSGQNSRTNSPFSSMANILRTGGHSPSNQARVAARLASPAHSPGRPGQDTDQSMEERLQPVEVTLCLEHLWTEQGGGAEAQRVFLASDTVGQQMICLLRSGQLAMVRMERTNEGEGGKVIFGAARVVPARDAMPVVGLAMVLVLEKEGHLTLYSGATKISRVALPSSGSALHTLTLTQEISALALGPDTPLRPPPSQAATPSLHLDLGSAPATPINYKRSSLLTSSRPPSASLPNFGNDSCLGTLSPVAAGEGVGQAGAVVSLQASQGRRVMLETSGGRMLDLLLPGLGSALVCSALHAVKLLLPKDLALALHSAWYSARHAPGPTPGPDKEWTLFSRCLLSLAGYQVDLLDLSSTSSHSTSLGEAGGPSKRCRQSEAGCDADWQFILGSAHHKEVGDSVSRLLDLDHPLHGGPDTVGESNEKGEVNSSSSLFPYIPAILWALHLLYEDLKLDLARTDQLARLASLLSRLAADLQLPHYQQLYWQEMPQAALSPRSPRPSQLAPALLSRLSPAPCMTPLPPSVVTHLTRLACRQPVEPFPLLPGLALSTQTLALCLAALSSLPQECALRPLPQPGRPLALLPPCPHFSQPQHAVAALLTSSGWEHTRLASLPPALAAPLLAALASCQQAPALDWPKATLRLVEREDLALSSLPVTTQEVAPEEQELEDGLKGLISEVSKLRWPKDQRLVEARRLLQSAKPVTVSVLQRPEVSDHDFMEEQEHFLKRLCERTMALPVGRGVAALRTTHSLPTEILSIPKLCLTGKAPPRGAKVELSHIDVSQNMEHWPSFHNGVAAGLRLSAQPGSQDIDSTWICFNKPKGGEAQAQTEHAGFLMALGLNGHLAKLGKLESFDYLMKGSEPISIGLLLGMAASRRGSMDVLITKKLSTQLEALLPPTATELPLSHNTQVASLMGLGLLYADTGHRRMVEVCLKELARPPGPELENCADRESYSLTAGLALGTITMGRGEALVAGRLADLSLPEVLHNHMVGGPRSATSSSSRERPPSYQIKEGDSINIDVTSPGATLALGMLYWRSGNRAIASWMDAPETSFLLEFVRPDFLLLRTLAKGLILWDTVTPSLAWVEAHVPLTILPFCLARPPDTPPPGSQRMDYETINQAYCNIVAGACFALALRFAGSWNNAAFDTINTLIDKFIAVMKRSIADLTGKAVVEQTLCILVLSQGIVMAGSGDLATLRTCRMLRARVHNSTVVNYGSHMAVHLAIGLLFLGGGRLGLATTPGAVAALIAAFFPKFPTHSSDNRYHLQALRHLYVLAVEPRLLSPRCSISGRLLSVDLLLTYRATPSYPALSLAMQAPVLLPSLALLSSVAVCDPQYWSTVFLPGDTDTWPDLASLLSRGGAMAVKRREGAGLPRRLHWSLGRAQLARLRTSEHWEAYCKLFLRDCPPALVASLHCLLSSCLASSCPALLPVWTSLLHQTSLDTAQASLAALQLVSLEQVSRQGGATSPLLPPELTVSLGQRTTLSMDRAAHWEGERGLGGVLAAHLSGAGHPPPACQERRHLVATALTLHGLGAGGQGVASRNPLRQRKVLGGSGRPASLYRLIS